MVLLADPALSRIRVASVPASHPYVHHIADPHGRDGVVRLADPTDPWWPPAALDPDWVDRHHRRFDLVHVHFGFDALEPATLAKVCDRLDAHAKALVVTVHDLRNPHHPSGELHEQQLGVLVGRAAVVLTLTDGAAAAIRTQFGREAFVVPHPHIVELDDMRSRQRVTTEPSMVVGLHLKSLRPNMEPRVVAAAAEAVRQVPGARLRIDVHLDVAEPGGARHRSDVMAVVRALEDEGVVDLHTHDYFDDGEFVDYLASLRASILPYRFGTHSGWLEACRDLGVTVVAPDCGFYGDQGPTLEFVCNERDGFDARSCTAAVASALTLPPPDPIGWDERLAQRVELARSHRDAYRYALASMAVGASGA
jgi:beta-1,4-mannosyltransferase